MPQTVRLRSAFSRSARALTLAAAAFIAAGAFSPAANADDYTDRANKPYKDISPDKRSDTVLLPLLAKMAPPPKPVATWEQAALLPSGKTGWDVAAAWAAAQPQQDVLKALATVTQEKEWRKAYAFGQPYGIEGVPIEMVQANLFTDLGDPPTLAGAKLHVLKALHSMTCLVHVEATRLTAEGKVSDAIDLLTNFMYFGRQMCDRQMFAEADWGLTTITQTCQRVRDVVYVDAHGPKALDTGRLKEQIKRLDDHGYLDLGRMKFPVGDRAGTEQIIARVFKSDGTLDEQVFAATMSRLTSTTRPLRLFSESGKWRSIGSSQTTRSEAQQMVSALFDDWSVRWNVPWFDKRLSNISPFATFDRNRHAALAAVAPEMVILYYKRHLARVENVGTRTSLAAMGHYTTIKQFPKVITALRSAWLPDIEADPFNPNTQNGAVPPLEYFVPIRDTAAFDGEGNPHKMRVVVRGEPFEVNLKDDVFVLYSVGSDNAKNNAVNVQNTYEVVQGADYLIWPPVVSLIRQHMIDENQFK